jgi:hypothetical protein
MIVGGLFTMLVGLQSPIDPDDRFSGPTIVLGALAYRSAKRRRLSLKPDTALRRGIEIGMLLLVFLPVPLLALRGLKVWTSNPVSGIVVPLWSLVAYTWILRRQQHLGESTSLR